MRPPTQSELDELANHFTYHPPTPDQVPVFEEIRMAGRAFAVTILTMVEPSPDRADALRKVREAVWTANAAVACYPEGKPE